MIVTFTNAASDEMKKRISDDLSKKIDENPKNFNLKRQQILLKRANIGTIDSFCNNLVKENFFNINISPNFKIAENNEISVLKEQVINKIFDELYEEHDSVFLELINIFSGDKDDNRFIEIIEKIYNFISPFPFQETWFEEKLELYNYKNLDVSKAIWGETILKYCEEILEFAIKLAENSLELSKRDIIVFEYYSEYIENILINLKDLLNNIKNRENWNILSQKINDFKCGTNKNKLKKDFKKKIKENIYSIQIENNNKEVSNVISKKLTKFFLEDSEKNTKKLYILTKKLFEIVKKFSKELDNLKLEKNLADFGDLERWTLKLLTKRDKKNNIVKSDLAKNLSEKFEEIMIDEYQDTNEIQNLIFNMISKNGKNLFLVGDVKQSIYGFRHANPENFIIKKNTYNLFDSFKSEFPVKIILDKNFRSQKNILNTINFIFECLMSERTSDINYNEEEKLTFGADYFEKNNSVELNIIYGESNISNKVIEAQNISKIISKMITKKYLIQDKNTKRPVTYKDFCILLRTTKNVSEIYSKELNKNNIPCCLESSENFFDIYEISVIISILKVIDNPLQDIPLASALMSPIFSFSSDDLSNIKLNNKNINLYFALKKEYKQNNKKCINFINKIDKYRNFASVNLIYDLINYICKDTDYISIIQTMPKGEKRFSNLKILLEFSKKFEDNINKELSEFLFFTDKLKEKNTNVLFKNDSSNVISFENQVKIMSIHKSKGLEFPICILAGCSREFNKNTDSILFNSELGLGFKLKDRTKIIKYDNLQRQAIKIKIKQQEISENLRLLYVAMTRAREKLIISAHVKNIEKYTEKLSNLNLFNKNKLIPYAVKNSKCFLDLILLCAFNSNVISNDLKEKFIPKNFWKLKLNLHDSSKNKIEEKIIETELLNFKINNDFLNKLKDRFNFKYKYDHLNKIPLKITATELIKKDAWKSYIAYSRPLFITNKSVNASERGTILHNFLYFANYKKLIENFDIHLSDLINNGFITKNQANVINKTSILKFLKSDLGSIILNSQKLFKEYRFTIDYENSILIGSIDCIFQDEQGNFNILEYKTGKINYINELKKYSRQLEIYKYAFEKCENVKIKNCVIYSFYLNKWNNFSTL
ncbi:MAG: helicase-exonuclease AddAB subunit AddA [Candidatus Paraimprobicoccus trichonymphae]|uniref:DNA 3'-5' helicase n=1 Tax=Candidatus Paraimprobicoccus trichonymphae TaxID=3033793 RepID=A0AA48I9K1_9FIRM|nr:MAG: helicase-exonuclease AddAB subunit AddA [Candidatus Paraimprobicoccus trichonymphae]